MKLKVYNFTTLKVHFRKICLVLNKNRKSYHFFTLNSTLDSSLSLSLSLIWMAASLLPSQSHTHTSLFLNHYRLLSPNPFPLLLRFPNKPHKKTISTTLSLTPTAHNSLTSLQSFTHDDDDDDSPNPKTSSSLRLAAVIFFLGCFTFTAASARLLKVPPPALASTVHDQTQGSNLHMHETHSYIS